MAEGTLPNQGIYQQRKAEAEAAYQRALANIAQQRGRVLQDFGFNAQFDEQGGIQSYGVDMANPYGAVQLQSRAQGGELDMMEEQSLSRGLGRSGLGAQGASQLQFAHGAEDRTLGLSFLDSIQSMAEGQRDALGEKNAAFLGIEQDQLFEALQNRLFNDPPAEEEGGKSLKDIVTVKAGKKHRTKEGVISWLKDRKKPRNPAWWAWRHPEAAKKLGMRVPKEQPARTIAERQVRQMQDWRREKRKAGWSTDRIRRHPNWVKLQKRKRRLKQQQKPRRPKPRGPVRTDNRRRNRRRRR